MSCLFSLCPHSIKDNDLRGVFFDRVFCVARYEVWIGLESSQRTACFWLSLKTSCCCTSHSLRALLQNFFVACTSEPEHRPAITVIQNSKKCSKIVLARKFKFTKFGVNTNTVFKLIDLRYQQDFGTKNPIYKF